MSDVQPVLIAGTWRAADAEGTFEPKNPAIKEPTGEVYPVSTLKDVEEAIEAAADSDSRGTVMADACDVNEERFTNRLVSRLGSDWSEWTVVARHGMDSQSVVAGAASILAKVNRDDAISAIEARLGIRIGSGYPSDPLTREAERELVSGELPHACLRWSWSTVSNAWGGIHSGPVPMRGADGSSALQSSLDEW